MAAPKVVEPTLRHKQTAPPPIPSELGVTVKFMSDYSALANKLGLTNKEAGRVALLNVLREENIRVYNLKAVERYMNALTQKENQRPSNYWTIFTWDWMPIRKYSKAIPIEALMTAEKIHDALGESVEFLVTEVSKKPLDPDPFLAVRAKGDNQLFVIERWDEPKFREGKARRKSAKAVKGDK